MPFLTPTPFCTGPTIYVSVSISDTSKYARVMNLRSALPIFTGRQSGTVPGGRSAMSTLLAGTKRLAPKAV